MGRIAAVALPILIALCQAAPAQTFDRGRNIDGLELADLATTQVFTLADVNGDGFPDIVTVGSSPDDDPAVIVLFNDRGGGFGGTTYFLDEEVDELDNPIAVLVADVGSSTDSELFGDLDGHPDIIVLDAGAELVLVLWGDGAGGFEFSQEAERFDLFELLEGDPVGLAAGNFDRENGTDLVVLDSGSDEGQLLFLCNLRRAPFISCGTAAVNTGGEEPIAVGTGDFNGDGLIDVVVLNSEPGNGSLLWFNGNGRGGFMRPSGPTTVLTQKDVTTLTVARVDANNTDDVIVSYIEELGGDSIQVFLGGARLSPRPVVQSVANSPVALARGDFDGDGISDLVAAQSSPENESFVMRGDGQGNFAGVQTSQGSLTGSAVAVRVADLDRDGDDDFVVARQDGTGFRIALNARIRGTPSPTFTGTPPTATPTPPPTHTRTPSNTATPTPIPTVPFDACPVQVGGMPVAVAAAHLNPDLNFDLVVADGQRLVSLLPDAADIRTVSCRSASSMDLIDLSPYFTRQETALSEAPSAIAVGNLDRGRAADDLAVAIGESILIFHGDGMGGFTAGQTLALPPNSGQTRSIAAIVIADLDNNGVPELITANHGNPILTVFSGSFENGRVRFGEPPLAITDPSSSGATAVVVASIDQQPGKDLVAILDSGEIKGFRQGAGLTFANRSEVRMSVFGEMPVAIASEYHDFGSGSLDSLEPRVADFDGDGLQDFAVAVRTSSGGKFVLLRGRLDSPATVLRFEPAFESSGTATNLMQEPVAIGAGHFDLRGGQPDALLDVVIADAVGRLFFFMGEPLTEQRSVQFKPLNPLGTAPAIVSLGVTDVDGDNRADVVVAHSRGSLSLIRSSQPFPTFTPTSTATPTDTPTQGSPTATQPTSTPEPPPPGTATPTGTPKAGTFTLSDGCAIGGEGSSSGAGMLWGGLLIWLARRRARRMAGA